MLGFKNVLIGVLLLGLAINASSEATSTTLTVRVTDFSGAPLAFRGYLLSSRGAFMRPSGLLYYEKKSTFHERHFLAEGGFSTDVPPGVYRLRIERGMEWVPWESEVHIEEDGGKSLEVVLERWIDLNASGWYSGDMHIHRAPGETAIAQQAEELNFAANTNSWNGKDTYVDARIPLPVSPFMVVAPGRMEAVLTQEIERLGDGWGAAMFVGVYQPVDVPGPYYPLTAALCKEARHRGAFIDFEKPVWRDTPVCAALGLVDSIGIVHNHFHPRGFLGLRIIEKAIVPPPKIAMTPRECALYSLDLYYHLLNCGLKIPVSGGSASGVMPSPVGFNRTYVLLEEPFTAESWLEGLRAGRSFATNGPVLLLALEGIRPGAEVELGASRKRLRVRCSAQSRTPTLERVEIVHNGKVIASKTGTGGLDEIVLDEEVELGPGWIAARCFEEMTETQIFAATSPVYLRHASDKGIVAESARYYADFVGTLIAQAEEERRFPVGEERAKVIETLEKARGFYEERAEPTSP